MEKDLSEIWQACGVAERVLLVSIFSSACLLLVTAFVSLFLWIVIKSPMFMIYIAGFIILTSFAYIMIDDRLSE